jgi:hypothetical protein
LSIHNKQKNVPKNLWQIKKQVFIWDDKKYLLTLLISSKFISKNVALLNFLKENFLINCDFIWFKEFYSLRLHIDDKWFIKKKKYGMFIESINGWSWFVWHPFCRILILGPIQCDSSLLKGIVIRTLTTQKL